jgi:methionine-rich copper-binding protein CopC
MELRMTRTFLAVAAALTLGATPAAFAHSMVAKTSITENASLAEAPAAFTATFEHDARVSNVKLVDATGAAVPLDFEQAAKMATTFTVPLPRLAAGKYALSWKSLSRDGHAMSSTIHFTITG